MNNEVSRLCGTRIVSALQRNACYSYFYIMSLSRKPNVYVLERFFFKDLIFGYFKLYLLFLMVIRSVTCKSLDSREFSRIFLKFHFSISSHFYFTFTSRSRFPVIFISLSFLEKSERDKNFTLFLEKKEWNFTPSFMKNLTILVSRVKNPKQIMSGIMNGDTQLFKIQQQIIQGSGFFYPY